MNKPKKITKKIYSTGGSNFILLPKDIIDFWNTEFLDISLVDNKFVIEPNYNKKTRKKKGA